MSSWVAQLQGECTQAVLLFQHCLCIKPYCTDSRRSFFATHARYQSSTLTAIELFAFDRERGYLFYRQVVSCRLCQGAAGNAVLHCRPKETLKESGLYPKSQKWPSATARQQSISQHPNLADQVSEPLSWHTYIHTYTSVIHASHASQWRSCAKARAAAEPSAVHASALHWSVSLLSLTR